MTLNAKKHTQEAAVKDVCRCPAVLNLRKKSLKSNCDSAGEIGGRKWGDGRWAASFNHTHYKTIKVEILLF